MRLLCTLIIFWTRTAFINFILRRRPLPLLQLLFLKSFLLNPYPFLFRLLSFLVHNLELSNGALSRRETAKASLADCETTYAAKVALGTCPIDLQWIV